MVGLRFGVRLREKDNKVGIVKLYNIFKQLGFFDFEKIRSWGIRFGKVRGE